MNSGSSARGERVGNDRKFGGDLDSFRMTRLKTNLQVHVIT